MAAPPPLEVVPIDGPAEPPGQNFLLLPDPVDGVLNHGGLEGNDEFNRPLRTAQDEQEELILKNPSSLEDACILAYLKYLENEIVTYISLTQSKSHLVKGVAKRMVQVCP